MREYADELRASSKGTAAKGGKKGEAETAMNAGDLLDDARFANLFQDPDFHIDKESEAYATHHPHAQEQAAAAPAVSEASAAPATARDGSSVRVEALFHRIDTDGSGSVDRSEIMAVHSGGDWAALFAKLDANGDGVVTMEEWRELFAKI